MAKPPDAFLSYTRFDDQQQRGKISEFRKELADEVRAVTGEPFEIFQDVDGIGLGEHWRGKLDEMLDQARFFIPILTPGYFKSEPCRDELRKFAELEQKVRRNDLILPIYWRTCPVLEDKKLCAADPLATLIDDRQRWDWRDLRHHSFRIRKVKLELEMLAKRIDDARRRAAPAPQPRAAAAESTSERSRSIRATTELSIGTLLFEAVPGRIFRDIDEPWCPEMVVIPPGEFMMGSTGPEKERPQHLVRIGFLAVGRYPVTFEEYGYFARSTGRTQPADEGWGRGPRPVINVDWEDSKSFAAWLSVQTRQRYRLLSEAEWEYACRAGSTTRHSWGDEITPEKANYEKILGRTSEVGSYPANAFGISDMQGNVWEWVEDRWHDSYEGAPDDGTAWTAGDDPRRVVRGGAWGNSRGVIRSSLRVTYDTSYRGAGVGFRVARTFA